MSQKLCHLRLVRINETTHFAVSKKHSDGALKTISEARREIERAEGYQVDWIAPAAFTDKNESGKTFGAILEACEFTAEDLPLAI